MPSVFRLEVCANYIPLRCKNEGVYQYDVQFSPDVDSRNMRSRLLLGQHADKLSKGRAFDGRILFLADKLPDQVSLGFIVCCRTSDCCNS